MLEIAKKYNNSWGIPLYKKDRLSVWQNTRGLLKKKIKDPLIELKKIRSEWDRKTS